MKKLNGHELVNGTFVAPMNNLPNLELSNWHFHRLPEYFWLCLILEQSPDRKTGISNCLKIIKFIIDNIQSDFGTPFFSKILSFKQEQQIAIYDFITSLGHKKSLEPLTLFARYSTFPTFACYFMTDLPITFRIETCEKILKKAYSHNSDFSTDIRYISALSCVQSKRIMINKDLSIVDAIEEYGLFNYSEDIKYKFGALIRSLEGAIWRVDFDACFFYKTFWEEINQMADEKIVNYEMKSDKTKAKKYLHIFKNVIEYYDELLSNRFSHSDREIVMFGLLDYSFTRYKEMVEHDLLCEPSGRSCMRTIIEMYLMTAYMLSKEKTNPNIWKQYRLYGAGEYKLTSETIEHLKFDSSKTHIQKEIVSAVSSSESDPMFTNMDVKYFADIKLREIAKQINEEAMYAMYRHDSSFDHGLWCAIIESSLLESETASSEYRKALSTDVKNRLLSVSSDAISILQKHIKMIEKEHPLPGKIKYE